MSSRRSMTRDIHESIRLLLGKNTKILLKVPVKLELKGKDNRILVFTPHRLFIVTAKVPSRVDHNFHYLDIKGIESKAPNHITFTVDKSYSFRPNYEQLDQTNSASTFDRLLQVLSEAIRRIFPGSFSIRFPSFCLRHIDSLIFLIYNNSFKTTGCNVYFLSNKH